MDGFTIVGEEYEDLGSYVVSLYIFQDGLRVEAACSIKAKGWSVHLPLSSTPEGPWSVAVTTEDGVRSSTAEYACKMRGQEWVNHAHEVIFFTISFLLP